MAKDTWQTNRKKFAPLFSIAHSPTKNKHMYILDAWLYFLQKRTDSRRAFSGGGDWHVHYDTAKREGASPTHAYHLALYPC